MLKNMKKILTGCLFGNHSVDKSLVFCRYVSSYFPRRPSEFKSFHKCQCCGKIVFRTKEESMEILGILMENRLRKAIKSEPNKKYKIVNLESVCELFSSDL